MVSPTFENPHVVVRVGPEWSGVRPLGLPEGLRGRLVWVGSVVRGGQGWSVEGCWGDVRPYARLPPSLSLFPGSLWFSPPSPRSFFLPLSSLTPFPSPLSGSLCFPLSLL